MNLNDRNINALQANTKYTQQETETLQYIINYDAILANGETIATSSWRGNGAAISSGSNTYTTTTAKISATSGKYSVVNTITTTDAQTIIRTIYLTVNGQPEQRQDF